MQKGYVVHDSSIPHFVTFTVVGWIDVFSREEYKEIVCESLKYCIQKKGLRLHAWVLMTNHIHLIITAQHGNTIPAIVRDMKKYTSKRIVMAISHNEKESRRRWMLNLFSFTGKNNPENEVFQFWQQEYHPICLDSLEKTVQRLKYLHENPVRAGIVWFPDHYKYSSAIDYYTGQKGILPLELLIV